MDSERDQHRHPADPRLDEEPWRQGRNGIWERDALVDAARAQQFLQLNVANYRLPRPETIERYARDMVNGRWDSGTGTTIDFGIDGHLCDGQNRLMALATAGVSLWLRLRRNVPESAVEHMDEGLKRTLGDRLRARGEEHYVWLASVATLLWRWEVDKPITNKRNPTHTEVLAWIDANPAVREAVAAALPLVRRPLKLQKSVAGALVYGIRSIDPDEAAAFVALLADGTGLTDENPILRLRDQVIKAEAKYTQEQRLARCIKAWNLWITGQPVKALSWRQGGSSPESFPDLIDADGQPHPPPFKYSRDEGPFAEVDAPPLFIAL